MNGERYWGKRMDAATGRYLTPWRRDGRKCRGGCPSSKARLRELMEHGGAGDLIAEVRSAQQLLPDTRFQSIEEAGLKAAITPSSVKAGTPTGSCSIFRHSLWSR